MKDVPAPNAAAVLPPPARLAASPERRLRHTAARRPDCPGEVLAQLADDELAVQLVVASREDTPQEALRRLAASPSRVVRRSAESSLVRAAGLRPANIETGFDYDAHDRVCNPNTPADELLLLAGNGHWSICLSLVHNPSCPVEALRRLAGHPHWIVRRGVAGCPATPDATLRRLEADCHQIVRGTAGRCALGRAEAGRALPPVSWGWEDGMLDSWPIHSAWGERLNDARDPNTTGEDLAALAEHPHWIVRGEAAIHPNCPLVVLVGMSGTDSHPLVRETALCTWRGQQPSGPLAHHHRFAPPQQRIPGSQQPAVRQRSAAAAIAERGRRGFWAGLRHTIIR